MSNTNKSKIDDIKLLSAINSVVPNLSLTELLKQAEVVRNVLVALKLDGGATQVAEKKATRKQRTTKQRTPRTFSPNYVAPENEAHKLLDLLKKGPSSLSNLSSLLNRANESVLLMADTLRTQGHNVVEERTPINRGRGYMRIIKLLDPAKAERVTQLG